MCICVCTCLLCVCVCVCVCTCLCIWQWIYIMCFQWLAYFLLFILTVVEFIYAQSPVNMKGLLLGCLFFTEGLALTLGSLLFLSQSKGSTRYWEYFKPIEKDANYCNVAIKAGSSISGYVIIAIITFLGIVLFFYSAKNYKSRIRGTSLKYFVKLY